MSKYFFKYSSFIIVLILILLFYFIFFFGITYKFESKAQLHLSQTTEFLTFNKNFHKNEIESIHVMSDSSNIIIEKSNNDIIEVSSKYNKKSLLSIKLKNKKLIIKQYSNNSHSSDNNKYLSIKLPSKDFKKLKIHSLILNANINKCDFQYIDIKSQMSNIDMVLEKSPKKTKLYVDTGNIKLNVPKSKNNKFDFFTLNSKLLFYNEEYFGLINESFGKGSSFFDIHCGFGLVDVY